MPDTIIDGKMDTKLPPLTMVGGYPVRPGLYDKNGATEVAGGVNFTLCSVGATACELVLFRPGEDEPFAVLPFPEFYRLGHVWAMTVLNLKAEEFAYAYRLEGPYDPARGLLFRREQFVLDPYAIRIEGQKGFYKGRLVVDDFDWGGERPPQNPMADVVIYEAHVGGFTRHESAGVAKPGTFAGLMEKKDYIKKLGVNAVELLPVFAFDENLHERHHNGKPLTDYWGYNPVGFFAPHARYGSGYELKELVQAFNRDGIDVFLDVVFNHTAEGGGDDYGRTFSFKGLDNNIYYMLTPDGRYRNFSGCGNTLNANHPIVRQMIVACLRYWVTEYHISGFRFDLASILGRGEDGEPMEAPPLLQDLALDPILAHTKLIAEPWDAGGLYRVGDFPAWGRWAEWNGKYRDDLRSFLKGDGGLGRAAALRIAGSADLYGADRRGAEASVNFITCHDGFTLHDLYAYNHKHNEENGWRSADGSDDNRSWNCGAEGPSDDPAVLALRGKLIHNALAVLLCSRGTPMLLAGDEFANSQGGNNNPYCQDNKISWLDWGDLAKNQSLHDFVRYLIAYRQKHAAIRKTLLPSGLGFPEVSFHGAEPWQEDYSYESRLVGVMFAGADDNARQDAVFVAVNVHWEKAKLKLPPLPEHYVWQLDLDTGRGNGWDCLPPDWESFSDGEEETCGLGHVDGDGCVEIEPRSVMVFAARQRR